MKIVWQLLKEFWFPLLTASGWVLFNMYSGSHDEWDLAKIVNVFGPTFFFLSWGLGQFFRVKKQSKVEQNFVSMETRLQDLVSKVEYQTNEMLSNFSGGDSFAYFNFSNFDDEKNLALLSVQATGRYPMYEVTGRIVDLIKLDSESYNTANKTIELGNLVPNNFKIIPISWKLSNDSYQRYNIFFSARNGSYHQMVKIMKIDGSWELATIVERNETVLHQFHSAKYPLNTEGAVDWS